jgi:hypothetical protein
MQGFNDRDTRQFKHEENHSLFQRSVKMNFPMYDGEEPSDWVYKANQYFFVHNTPHEYKNLLASFNMEGKALIWFEDMHQFGSLPNWETLTQGLLDRFGPSAYDDPMESLTRLKHRTFMEDYKGKFEVLSNRLRVYLKYISLVAS